MNRYFSRECVSCMLRRRRALGSWVDWALGGERPRTCGWSLGVVGLALPPLFGGASRRGCWPAGLRVDYCPVRLFGVGSGGVIPCRFRVSVWSAGSGRCADAYPRFRGGPFCFCSCSCLPLGRACCSASPCEGSGVPGFAGVSRRPRGGRTARWCASCAWRWARLL